jgi:CheY-like chemotaxis protein
MSLQSLLLSRDPHTIRILRQTLEKLSIEMEVCRGARSGNEILASEKFDAVIIDCDDLQGGLEVLQNLRKTSSNRNSTAFAILSSTSTHRAFELGASFVLQKPLSALNTTRCFSAGLGLMEREKRRYFRHPLEIGVSLFFGQGEKIDTTTTNLSEGGLALRFRGRFPRSGLSRIAFTMPAAEKVMECKAEVAWVDDAGQAGIRFLETSRKFKRVLEDWLDKQAIPGETNTDKRQPQPSGRER